MNVNSANGRDCERSYPNKREGEISINIKKVTLLFSAFLLFGCSDNQNSNSKETVEIKSHIDDPVNITEEEAIEIALQQAEVDGYESPTLLEGYPSKITFVYSIKNGRDMKVYDVSISTPEKMFAVFYYVSTENGEIIESTH